ncbi:MAG: MaoC family dehydratase [Dehalococcoidia bacterium]|nr:MaoC family dehydratase [Dehalococcoidia bacterium]
MGCHVGCRRSRLTAQGDIKFDRSQLGVEHPAGTFQVTKEMILEYSRAVGETNPAFSDQEAAKKTRYGGLVAPPSFVQTLTSDTGRPDIRLEFGEVGAVASQAFESLEAIRPGDILESTIKLKDVYAKTGRSGTMVFVVWETAYTNQSGKKVAVSRATTLRMANLRERRNVS